MEPPTWRLMRLTACWRRFSPPPRFNVARALGALDSLRSVSRLLASSGALASPLFGQGLSSRSVRSCSVGLASLTYRARFAWVAREASSRHVARTRCFADSLLRLSMFHAAGGKPGNITPQLYSTFSRDVVVPPSCALEGAAPGLLPVSNSCIRESRFAHRSPAVPAPAACSKIPASPGPSRAPRGNTSMRPFLPRRSIIVCPATARYHPAGAPVAREPGGRCPRSSGV